MSMSIFDTLMKRIKQTLAFPCLMRIDTVRIEKSKGGYNADGEIVVLDDSGEFDTTGEALARVPVCIPGATKSGAGLFAQADADQIAVVQYIDGNRAYPIITGYYTDEYEPAADDTAVISLHAGKGTVCIASEREPAADNTANISLHAGKGTVRIANETTSLFSVLDKILDALLQLKTQGGPSNQVISPTTIKLLQTQKGLLVQVLKE